MTWSCNFPCDRPLSRGGHFVSGELQSFVYARLSFVLDYIYATKDEYACFSNQIRLPQNLIYDLSPLGLVVYLMPVRGWEALQESLEDFPTDPPLHYVAFRNDPYNAPINVNLEGEVG